MTREAVIIVGAGPSGIATAACLNRNSIPYIVLEKEDCLGSMWKKHSYDCLSLHLGKQFCELPHLKLPRQAPTFISKADFIKYLDEYAENFGVTPKYKRVVMAASFDKETMTWHVVARNNASGEIEEYSSRFLVVATGENAEGVIPEIPGLHTFQGEAIHSHFYKSGTAYKNKRVLVVGSGNSGMEIAYDLAVHGAKTSIVIRSPFHIFTKDQIFFGMRMLKYFPVKFVDALIVAMGNFEFGDLSRFGIVRPREGPFALKARAGRSSVLDVGTVGKIKDGEIKVYGPISSVDENMIQFMNGKSAPFDALIFSTGYKSTTKEWLEDNNETVGETGFPKKRFPHQWKGCNGLYCAGFAQRGLAGIAMDALNIAEDIRNALK